MTKAFPHNRSHEPAEMVRPRSAPPIRGAFAIRSPAQEADPEGNDPLVSSRIDHSSGSGKLGTDIENLPSVLPDCLRRTAIQTIDPLPQPKRCVATVGSAGYADLLDNLLGSLHANGGLDDVLLVVFVVNGDPDCRRIAENYGAQVIDCRSLGPVGVGVKSVLYSVARVVEAAEYLCLDADMVVLGDLQPVFQTLAACWENAILVCREGNRRGRGKLEHALKWAYRGSTGDIEKLLGESNGEGTYPLIVNDGLFAGSRKALLALDATIRQMPDAPRWIDEEDGVCWRNQFVFNLALARLHSGVELKPEFNLQLHAQSVKLQWDAERLLAAWENTPVRVLHLSGHSKFQYPHLCRLFSSGERLPLESDGNLPPFVEENTADG